MVLERKFNKRSAQGSDLTYETTAVVCQEVTASNCKRNLEPRNEYLHRPSEIQDTLRTWAICLFLNQAKYC